MIYALREIYLHCELLYVPCTYCSPITFCGLIPSVALLGDLHLLWPDTVPSVSLREIGHLPSPAVAVGAITFYSLLLLWESSPSTARCCCGSHHLLQHVVAVGVVTFHHLLLLWEPCFPPPRPTYPGPVGQPASDPSDKGEGETRRGRGSQSGRRGRRGRGAAPGQKR